jgi:lipid-binding SYLF domain-containing protein
VIKGGFLYGGQTGNGVLFQGGVTGFYNTSAVSYGLQAGLQNYGYALFFMNQGALSYLNKSAGLELGVGPSVVVADAGFAKSYTSTTLTQDVYAFVFDQKGIMAGLGITGSKITRLAQ